MVVASYQWKPAYQWTPAFYFFVRGQGQMLLYIYKMGVHCYLQFAEKTANNRNKMLKYKVFKQM